MSTQPYDTAIGRDNPVRREVRLQQLQAKLERLRQEAEQQILTDQQKYPWTVPSDNPLQGASYRSAMDGQQWQYWMRQADAIGSPVQNADAILPRTQYQVSPGTDTTAALLIGTPPALPRSPAYRQITQPNLYAEPLPPRPVHPRDYSRAIPKQPQFYLGE